MTFIEATSSGKNFRHPDMKEGCYFGFKDDELREFFADGGNSFPCFTHRDFTRDDYEFVPEPVVIEVGDTVTYGESPEMLVTFVKETHASIIKEDTVTLPSYGVPCKDLKLIRKGNVHTFEDMTILKDGWRLEIGAVDQDRMDNLCDGKRYTMILKEEL